jgi:DinB superfamily
MTDQPDNTNAALAQYADGPAQLEAALVGLNTSDLNLALTADTWTIRQIAHHITDGDDIWKICIKAALGNSEGLFSLQWYWDKPQTEWAEAWGYARRSIESSIELFRANRHHIEELVRQNPNAWDKSIRLKFPDSKEERITVGDILEMQTRHVVGHINDIQEIRRAHNI